MEEASPIEQWKMCWLPRSVLHLILSEQLEDYFPFKYIHMSPSLKINLPVKSIKQIQMKTAQGIIRTGDIIMEIQSALCAWFSLSPSLFPFPLVSSFSGSWTLCEIKNAEQIPSKDMIQLPTANQNNKFWLFPKIHPLFCYSLSPLLFSLVYSTMSSSQKVLDCPETPVAIIL